MATATGSGPPALLGASLERLGGLLPVQPQDTGAWDLPCSAAMVTASLDLGLLGQVLVPVREERRLPRLARQQLGSLL